MPCGAYGANFTACNFTRRMASLVVETSRQRYDGFNVFGERKHIYRLYLFYLVPALAERKKVARERFGVAGNVDDAFRREGKKRIDKTLTAACAGRIGDNRIDFFVLFGKLLHKFARIGGNEFCIFYAVELGVDYRIGNGVGVRFDTDNRFCLACQRKPDSAGSAICVDDFFLTAECGKFQNLIVKHLGLLGVDLIKGARTDTEAVAEKIFGYISFAVQSFALFAEKEGCFGLVDVPNDRRYIGMLLQKCVDKIALFRKIALGGNEHYHSFAAVDGTADKRVAEKSFAGVYVVRLDFKRNAKAVDGFYYLVGVNVLEQAFLCLHYSARCRLIDTADDSAVSEAERARYFVAVVVGVLHTDDFIDVAVFSHKLYDF